MSPFKLARDCWLPSRSIFGKRARASINRTSPWKGGEKGGKRERKENERGRSRPSRTHRTSSRTPLARPFFPLCCSSSVPEAIHHTTHWIRVLHHNGGPNQYKPRVSCVVHHFHLSSHERIRRRSVGERSPCAPQCSNLKGLPEPEIRHLAHQVGSAPESFFRCSCMIFRHVHG